MLPTIVFPTTTRQHTNLATKSYSRHIQPLILFTSRSTPRLFLNDINILLFFSSSPLTLPFVSSRFTRFFVSENTLSQILVFELVLQIDADIHRPHHIFSYPPIVWDIPDLFSRMIFCPFFSNQTRSLLHSLISPAGRSFCCKCTAATAQSCHFFLTYRGCFISMRFSISNSRRHLQFISAGFSNFYRCTSFTKIHISNSVYSI